MITFVQLLDYALNQVDTAQLLDERQQSAVRQAILDWFSSCRKSVSCDSSVVNRFTQQVDWMIRDVKLDYLNRVVVLHNLESKAFYTMLKLTGSIHYESCSKIDSIMFKAAIAGSK